MRLEVKDLQQREPAWELPELVGKDNRVRTVTVPAGVRAHIDGWTAVAGTTEGRLFRPVTEAGAVKGSGILDKEIIWRLVVRYARETELGKLTPMTCGIRARAVLAGTWSRASCCWAMPSPNYRAVCGTEQQLASAVIMDWGWNSGMSDPTLRTGASPGWHGIICVKFIRSDEKKD